MFNTTFFAKCLIFIKQRNSSYFNRAVRGPLCRNSEVRRLRRAEGYRNSNTSTVDFTYNANGSMKRDLDRGIDVTYNPLNLPQEVKESSGNLSVNYIYTATGQKLAALYLNSSTLVGGNRYHGPLVQRWDNGSWVNDYIPTAEGRLAWKSNAWVPQYFLKDHLGNTRSVVERGTSSTPETGWAKQVWQQSYYPFGMTLGQSYVAENNQLTYNGKERQDFALNTRALDWLDYGARFYDPILVRWHAVDPLGEITPGITPYVYCFNNPIGFIDSDGMQGEPVVWNLKIDEVVITGYYSPLNFPIYGEVPMPTINFNSFVNVDQSQYYLNNLSYLTPLPGYVTGDNSTPETSTKNLLSSYGRRLVSGAREFFNQAQYSVPVWGACKQFGDCMNNGDYLGAGVNFALAFAEAFTLGYGAEIRLGMSSVTAVESGVQYTKSTLQIGQQMHKAYKVGDVVEGVAMKEFRGIPGIRPDFVDFSTKTIYELKPFNPRAMQQGWNQLYKYQNLFQQNYGGTWKIVLETY